MNFIEKYSSICRAYYLVTLGLTIPLYRLLYGASGHRFDPPKEDIVWMGIIIAVITLMLLNMIFNGLVGSAFLVLKVLLALTVLATGFGGLKVFISMLKFQFGDDVGIVIRMLSYLVPFLFIVACIVILADITMQLVRQNQRAKHGR